MLDTFKAANETIGAKAKKSLLYKGRPAIGRLINSGFCEEWADFVCERLPGAEKEIGFDGNHVAVRYQGRLYDAECHGGAVTLEELPFGQRPETVAMMKALRRR